MAVNRGRGAATRSNRYQKSSSFVLSCFGCSPVSEADEHQDIGDGSGTSRRKISGFFCWSRFRGKKKTVPVDASAENTVPPDGAGGLEDIKSKITPPAKAPPLGKNPFPKTQKDTRSKTGTKRHHHRQQTPADDTNSLINIVSQNKTRTHCIVSKCYSNTQPPTPLHRLHNSTHTATPTTPLSSPTPTHTATTPTPHKIQKKCEVVADKLHPDNGLLMVAVALVVLLLFGRAFAIVCMSAWFYLSRRLRAMATSKKEGSPMKKGSNEREGVDFEEYKKRVVLQGLLERNGRRP